MKQDQGLERQIEGQRREKRFTLNWSQRESKTELTFSGAKEARDRIGGWPRENEKKWRELPKQEVGRCGQLIGVLMA
jgi:hypothetical protein